MFEHVTARAGIQNNDERRFQGVQCENSTGKAQSFESSTSSSVDFLKAAKKREIESIVFVLAAQK